MSEVIDPPTYYFSGLNFNPAFYETGGLSIAQANALYLKKTVPDTATALETFNAGIVTPSITPTDDFTLNNPITSDLSIKTQNSTTGKIDMLTGDYSSGTVNILTGNFATGTFNLGGEDATVNLNGTNVNIANTANSVNAVNIMCGSLAEGTVDIMTGVGAFGTINIGGGSTTLSSDTITIGNSDTLTTMNATNIKQVIKTVGGSLIENTVGNTTLASSMSVTFNRKYITPVGGAVNCYTITSNATDQFTNQYFEIFVSGANNSRGGYTYKGCFGVEKKGGASMTTSAVSQLFYLGSGVNPPTSTVPPVITFSLSGQILTLLVNTAGGGSSDQNFITTLTSYPTASIRGAGVHLEDFIITAV